MLLRILAGLFIVAGVVAHLLQTNLPHHQATVFVVEWQTWMQAPLAPSLIGIGLAGLVWITVAQMRRGTPLADIRKPRRAGASAGGGKRPSPSPTGAAPLPMGRAPAEPDWRRMVLRRATELPFEAGVSMTLRGAHPLPFEMTVGDVPPERARRSFALLAEFLADVPCPEQVHLRFDGFREVGATRKRLVSSAFARHFPAAEFSVGPEGDGLAVTFADHDPRWSLEPD